MIPDQVYSGTCFCFPSLSTHLDCMCVVPVVPSTMTWPCIAYSAYCITRCYYSILYQVVSLCRVLWPQSLYLSIISLKNRYGHRVCWMSKGRKNGSMWRAHDTYSVLDIRYIYNILNYIYYTTWYIYIIYEHESLSEDSICTLKKRADRARPAPTLSAPPCTFLKSTRMNVYPLQYL